MRQARVGMWTPYIPKRGVPYGCRVGHRTSAESFSHYHSASSDVHDFSQHSHQVEPKPHMVSAFDGHGLLLETGGEPARRLLKPPPDSYYKRLVHSSQDDSSSSTCHRLHVGKITAESNNIERVHIRNNNPETFIPLDNLGQGLNPYIDRVADVPYKPRIETNRKNVTSRPDGPIHHLDIHEDVQIPHADIVVEPPKYVRKYGIQSTAELYSLESL